jgi:type IV pilus assembly protein PilW
MNISKRQSDAQAGFSLVELMVGMLLGLILIAGAVSIYLASRRSFVEVEQVAALSENVNFAEWVITDSLRHAGFFGEVPAARIDVRNDVGAVTGDCAGAAAAYDLGNHIFAATASGSIGDDVDGTALGCIDDAMPGTDVLVIKQVVPLALTDGPRDASDPNNPLHSDGVIDTPRSLQSDKTYVMTNSVLGILFDGADTPPGIGPGDDVPDGVAWEYRYQVFYVRRVGSGQTPRLSRKVLSWNGTGMELVTEDLVEGVENLRMMFGFAGSPSGELDSYANASDMAGNNWPNVLSVDAFLVLRSATDDVQYRDTKTYTLGDATYGPTEYSGSEQYRRLVSRASVSLRNIKMAIRGGA